MTSPKPPAGSGEAQPGMAAQDGGQKPPKSVHEEFDAVHNRYFRAVHDTWQNLHKRLQEHQKELRASYQGLFQSAPAAGQGQEAQSNFLKSQHDYLRGSQNVFEEALKSAAEAYKEYLRSMQREMGRTDVEQLDPPLVAAISQSMLMVAACAQRIRGLRAW